MPLIHLISSDDARTVRYPVLRDNKPYESCFFIEDTLASTFHLGLFDQKILVGVATCIRATTPLDNNFSQYQLRGMAVLPKFQNNGYGGQLLAVAVTHIKKLGGKIIWCNARAVAAPFYSKHNFEIIGSSFDIPKIGKHYCMLKKL